jgi:glutamine synthetase
MEGRNIFSVSDAELQTGRVSAANEDTKFISQEAEWFLAGILDGIADGMLPIVPLAFLELICSDAQ